MDMRASVNLSVHMGGDPGMDFPRHLGRRRARQEEAKYRGPAHLGGHHCAEFGKQHVSREGKDNDVPEVGKPHHPLEVSYILDSPSRKQ